MKVIRKSDKYVIFTATCPCGAVIEASSYELTIQEDLNGDQRSAPTKCIECRRSDIVFRPSLMEIDMAGDMGKYPGTAQKFCGKVHN